MSKTKKKRKIKSVEVSIRICLNYALICANQSVGACVPAFAFMIWLCFTLYRHRHRHTHPHTDRHHFAAIMSISKPNANQTQDVCVCMSSNCCCSFENVIVMLTHILKSTLSLNKFPPSASQYVKNIQFANYLQTDWLCLHLTKEQTNFLLSCFLLLHTLASKNIIALKCFFAIFHFGIFLQIFRKRFGMVHWFPREISNVFNASLYL